MSVRGLLISALCLASVAEASTVRLLLSVGNNVGDPDDAVLRFARADATRVVGLFRDLGDVDPSRAVLVLDQPAAVVKERLAELAGRAAELTSVGHDVVLLLYVSSHAKDGVLHLGGTHLEVAELQRLAEGTRARVQVLIVDACDSGSQGRRKGGLAVPEYEVTFSKLALEGRVFVASSGPAEPSQEWASLGGSLFTHHLLTGLRGDADTEGDGRVTLAEAYAYAYRRTVLDGVTSAQHPSFDYALSGSGELVLTEPAKARSALVFPSRLVGRYVVASQPRPDVVAEVDKRLGQPLRLAVPPGRYLVRKKLGAEVGVLTVELPWGGEAEVDEKTMQRRAFTEVAEKGGVVELTPSMLLATAQLGSEPLAATGARWRAGVAFRETWGPVWLWSAFTMGTARTEASLITSETSASLEVAAGWRWVLNPVSPLVGLSLEGLAYFQRYQRLDAAAFEAAGALPIPERQTLGLVPGLLVGLEVPLISRLSLQAQVVGQLRFLPAIDQPTWTFGVRGSLAVGWRF